MTVGRRLLRDKRDGSIYNWTSQLAVNPYCEEITHEEAKPEKHIPQRIVEARPVSRVDLSIDDVTVAQANDIAEAEAIPATPAELAREAARGLADELR